MNATGRGHGNMFNLSTTFTVIVLVIVVNQAEGQVIALNQDWDQIAQETQPIRIITLVDGPKYVPSPRSTPANHSVYPNQSSQIDPSIPPSKPFKPSPSIQGKQLKYVDANPPRPMYYNNPYSKPKPAITKQPYGPYKYPKVTPTNGHRIQYYPQPGAAPARQPSLAYSASSGKPVYVKGNSPKFSIPVQTVNGIRYTEVRPPKLNSTRPHNTTTSTTTTTTVKPLRNKRIWPKHILAKMNGTHLNDSTTRLDNTTVTKYNSTKTNSTQTDNDVAASYQIRRYVTRTNTTTTTTPATTRGWRMTRVPKHKSTTAKPLNATSDFKPNDWIPIVPHFPNMRRQVPIRRSDVEPQGDDLTPAQDRRMLFLHSVGLVPLQKLPVSSASRQKKYFFRQRKRQLKPNIYSGYSRKPSRPRIIYGDLRSEGASHPRVVTKIKHHHHHHHHKYIKTVEKPVKVPVKVEVPKPYPVPVERRIPFPVEKIKLVEKQVPYPVQVEKRVPYAVHVRVPQPFPVKVVEKEFVPKPYPVVQQVPVYKQVEVKVPHPVPVAVEKKVPVAVHVRVPVDRPVPVPVPVRVEKKVHVPVPVRVFVPQPYPVETKVPYPVEVKVKEPYEVIKHVRVPVRVPVPHPVPIKVPQPVPITIEKKVPYPVEVEKKVPVPFKVYVPQRIEVEKKVPVYVPRPYPVEKRVPVPFKVPVPVKVPVKVPVQVPIYVGHLTPTSEVFHAVSESSHQVSDSPITQSPLHTVTVHGNGAFSGFAERSDITTTPPAS